MLIKKPCGYLLLLLMGLMLSGLGTVQALAHHPPRAETGQSPKAEPVPKPETLPADPQQQTPGQHPIEPVLDPSRKPAESLHPPDEPTQIIQNVLFGSGILFTALTLVFLFKARRLK